MADENPYASPAQESEVAPAVIEPPQTIRFTPAVDDYVDAYLLSHRRVRAAFAGVRRRKRWLMGGGLALAALAGLLAWYVARWDEWLILLECLGVVVFFIGLAWKTGEWTGQAGWRSGFARDDLAASYRASGFGPEEGEAVFTVSTNGLRREDAAGVVECRWRSITETASDENCLIAWRARSNDPLVLPARVFTSTSTYLGLCQLIKRLHTAAIESERSESEANAATDAS